MKPLVSILIPAFNDQEWIADTLRSALAQTWSRKEIIVVDDGSTDRTLEIARHFESEMLRVVTQENQGAAAARNRAFSLARGDYIQWLDADDLLAPDKISSQMEAIGSREDKQLLLSCPWGRFMYRPGLAKFTPTGLWCDLSPTEWLLRKMEQGAFMQTATWLVTRELTEAAGPWNADISVDDDGEYFSRVLLASDGTRFVPGANVYYRWTGSSRLSYIGRSDKKRESQWQSMCLHIGYLRSLEDSERVRTACVKFLQHWLIYFYPERPDIVTQIEQMASDLGGRVAAPQLSWKYSWMKTVFGYGIAKRARFGLPLVRWSLTRLWDKAMSRVERRTHASILET